MVAHRRVSIDGAIAQSNIRSKRDTLDVSPVLPTHLVAVIWAEPAPHSALAFFFAADLCPDATAESLPLAEADDTSSGVANPRTDALADTGAVALSQANGAPDACADVRA